MASYDDTATVSGSVVSIENGADEVGAKSCVVTVSPTLSGVSSVSEKQTRRNLFSLDRQESDPSPTDIFISPRVMDVTKYYRGMQASNYYYKNYVNASISDGVLTVMTTNNNNYGVGFPIEVKPNTTYTLSGTFTNCWNSVGCYDENWNFIERVVTTNNTFPHSFTTSANAKYAVIVISTSTNVEGTAENIQIELGSTAHAYEPYTTPTVYTASLGRTIYGGEVDIVNGEGQDYALWVDMSTIKWTADTNRAGVFYGTVAGRKTATADEPSDVLGCTCYDVNNVTVTTGIDNYISGARSYGGNIIFFRDSAFSGYTREQVQEALQGEKVCVVSANPTDFTFTGQEVPTRLGYNAFWSEQGNTELTYYKDGYGFTSVTLHKETPSGEPVVETAKFHKLIYGGEVDAIRGTAKPKNLLDASTGTGANTIWYYYDNGILLKKDVTYTFSCGNRGSGSISLYGTDHTTQIAYAYITDSSAKVAYKPTEDIYVCPRIYQQSLTPETVVEPQLEVGATPSEYVPHFEPFTFPPIIMKTDEGENTLYADEGDSVITYRKETT